MAFAWEDSGGNEDLLFNGSRAEIFKLFHLIAHIN